jgi:hypothetical protein
LKFYSPVSWNAEIRSGGEVKPKMIRTWSTFLTLSTPLKSRLPARLDSRFMGTGVMDRKPLATSP